MKNCVQCAKSVKDLTFECPFCGGKKFQKEEDLSTESIKPTKSQTIIKEDGFYSQKLEGLIDLALSDGELTEKEKQVLFKKAEAEGIDLDEFEMVLDAKLKQLQTSSKLVTSSNTYTQQSLSSPPEQLNTLAPAISIREAYNQLEYLIDIGLKDGLISDLERHTIIEKGISLGISRNEIEMILTNKIDEKINTQTAAPKSDKFGDIKKCPACGSIIQAFTAICADCGHNFSNVNAVSSVTKLYEQLQIVESEERNRKVESSGWIDKFQASAATNDHQMEERVKKRKAGVVSGFPVPNTKEDILEFLSMAVPEAGKKPNFLMMQTASGTLFKAWHSKAEQVIMKARFSLKEDKRLLEEINAYAKELGIK